VSAEKQVPRVPGVWRGSIVGFCWIELIRILVNAEKGAGFRVVLYELWGD